MDIKNNGRGRCSELLKQFPTGVQYFDGKRPWDVYEGHADVILPAATQNEVNEDEARRMVEKCGITMVAEAANMPSEEGAINVYHEKHLLYGPAKAVNAGGVATSGLEMT